MNWQEKKGFPGVKPEPVLVQSKVALVKDQHFLTCVMGAAEKETLTFYTLGFARALSNRMNLLSSKRENDVISSVYPLFTKS